MRRALSAAYSARIAASRTDFDRCASWSIRAAIGETLIHEVGHYFGLSEEEIEEIEERYWRGDTLGTDEDDDEDDE